MKAFLIDTNYILRFFLGDIPFQRQKTKELFSRIEKGELTGYISLLVVNELIWILENFYRLNRKDYLPYLVKLLSLKKIKVLEIKKDELLFILQMMEKEKLDFTDLYLKYFSKVARIEIASFDKKLLRLG